MDVGIRELKARLSAYLDQVEQGATIRVTERGRPKAMLVPVADDPLDRGIAEGWVTLGPAARSTDRPPPPPPLRGIPGVRAADLLDHDRGT